MPIIGEYGLTDVASGCVESLGGRRIGAKVYNNGLTPVKLQCKNSYFYPLDRAIRLEPRQETTLWVKKRACELATKYAYREAASLLSAEIGEEISQGNIPSIAGCRR